MWRQYSEVKPNPLKGGKDRGIAQRLHEILHFNREVLKPPIGSTTGNAYRVAMQDIADGVLQAGTNELEIERMSDEDDFDVRNVVVHWREQV